MQLGLAECLQILIGKDHTTESTEVEPDPDALNCDGSITYYEAGTTAEEIQNGKEPEKTVCGTGHDLVHHEAKAATCTEAGYKAYDTCSR